MLSSHPIVRDESAYAATHLSYAKDDTCTALALRGFYLDVRKPHAEVNMGETPRVHLVVDCYANAAIVEMLRNATPASQV